MQILVIGGNGFIGINLVRALLTAGYDIRIYDRADSPFLDRLPGVDYIYGDLGNTGLLSSALNGVDLVYHLAATTKPETSNNDPAFDVVSNVADTIKLLDECVRLNIKKIIFTSSGGTVYGVPEEIPIKEIHPTNPICSYGITKLAIEKYLSLYNRLYGLEYTILRPSNPFGPFQNPFAEQGAVSVFMHSIIKQRPITIWGDGSVIRDYLYIEDLIGALLLAAEVKSEGDPIFNISSGVGLSLNELIESIKRVVKEKIDVEFQKSRKLDVPVNILDNQQSKNVIGWNQKFSLEEGLEITYQWLKKILKGTQ